MADLCLLLLKRRLMAKSVGRERVKSESSVDELSLSDELKTIRRRRRSSTRESSSRSGGGLSILTISTVLVLSLVFLLGALSAVIITIWRTDVRRNGRFQPLPLVEHLQVLDERDYLALQIDPDGECEGENSLGLELEAISSIHAALEMKENGKLKKAQKLFQHAMALCPRHPDVLTQYGFFFEETDDYLMADHLYVQALTYSPHHSQALVNRKRTLPVVEEIDEKRLQKIDGKKELLSSVGDASSSLQRIRKEAYFQHLYHSAGIEGNTLTLSQTRMIIETRMAIGGKSIIEHNEILGLDAAMKFINHTLVNRIGTIRVEDILDVHRHVMSFVDPSEAGQFRKTQVYVGSHVPPSPVDLQGQMDQLIEWLNSDEALGLHPIHYSAIFHYKMVYIHPFQDGNGRTARLLMNWVLMQGGFPPVIISKQDRHLYYDHLDTANKGDVRPFIRFIATCTEKTLDAYLYSIHEIPQYHLQGPTPRPNTIYQSEEDEDDPNQPIRSGEEILPGKSG